jgi:uncharacterized protein
MKVLIDINHPAHVHLFKNTAWQLQAHGHVVLFTTRNKEIAHILLKNLGFNFISFGKPYKKMLGKLWGILKYDFMLWRISQKFKPDMLISMGGIYPSHVSRLIHKPHILWTDTENATFQHLLSIPFSDVVMNPVCFEKKFNKYQVYYKGYHELAYLHPNCFKPDRSVFHELGLKEDEHFVIIRFVAWNASHDVGHKGITLENKIAAVKEFSKYARVFITSEGKIPDELREYQMTIPVERIHHALAFCSLLYGESATMASECAVLGVPSIYIDNEGRGYTREEQYKYNLVYNFSESVEDQRLSIMKGIEILNGTIPQATFSDGQKKLLADKIDVTAFMVWFIENYPSSREIMNRNPDFQARFAF